MRAFIFLLTVLFVLTANAVQAAQVQFADFSDTSVLTLNGSAATVTTSDGVVLRLAPALGSQSGSAFSTTTVNAADFSTFFKFRITEPGGSVFDCNEEPGADGIVFVAQSVRSDIGGSGGGIGYAGISPSVGVEFDTWCNAANNDPNSNHVGIDENGSVAHGSPPAFVQEITPDFDNGDVWYVWIDYNGTTLEARVSPTPSRPAAPTVSKIVDIPSILGQTSAYVGFTSGTGSDWGNHDILFWEYRDSFDPISGDSSGSSDICCGEYDFFTNTLTVPCVEIGGSRFWLKLELAPSATDLMLRLKDWGQGDLCGGGTPDGGPSGDACDDCSCPDYAESHPSECGQTGDLNFRLTWNDFNDVDLHVVYSGAGGTEEIYYYDTFGAITGGELDVDANAGCSENVTDRAVENIFYDSPPPGTYTLRVCGYEDCPASGSSSSVTAQVLAGGALVWEERLNVSAWDDTCVDIYTHTVN